MGIYLEVGLETAEEEEAVVTLVAGIVRDFPEVARLEATTTEERLVRLRDGDMLGTSVGAYKYF